MLVTTIAIWFLWAAPTYVLGGFLALIIHAARGPLKGPRFSAVKSYIEHVLYYGFDGGYVSITEPESSHSIRFRKYVREKGVYGIELIFSEADSSPELHRKLTDHCRNHGWAYSQPDAVSTENDANIRVDCGWSADRAFELAHEIWTNYFGLTDRTRYDISVDELSQFDELIDSPGKPAPSKSAVDARRMGRWQGSISLLVIGLFVALPIETLVSLGESVEWSIELGTMEAGGSTAGLVIFVIYLITLTTWFMSARWKTGPKPKVDGLVRTYVRVLRSLLCILPIAVVLVWIGA